MATSRKRAASDCSEVSGLPDGADSGEELGHHASSDDDYWSEDYQISDSDSDDEIQSAGDKKTRQAAPLKIIVQRRYKKRLVESNGEPDENQRQILLFSEKVGLKRKIQQGATSLQFFQKFFTPAVMTHIVDMTNLNAKRKISSGTWSPLTVPEFHAFLGLTILMGIVRMPEVKLYWQKKHWIIDMPSVNMIMARTRFLDIWKYLNFCDESQPPDPSDPSRDQLYKIRPLLDLVLEQFGSVYTPRREIAIDESMIPYKGRQLSFWQLLPVKRARCAMKVWVLAESNTGYVSQLQVYAGKDLMSHETELATRVVNDLIGPFEGKGYHLYLDNFFSSPELFRSLYDRKVYACGAVRSGRKDFPKDLQLEGRHTHPTGRSKWRMSGPLLAQSWQDNRPVYFLSTIHDPTTSENVRADALPKRLGPKSNHGASKESETVNRGVKVPCPPLLHSYNSFMGGGDLKDQCRKYYNIGRLSRAWYRRIFFYLVEVAINNSRVVAASTTGTDVRDPLQFRSDLVSLLVGDTRAKRAAPRLLKKDAPERRQDVGLHLPTMAPDPRVCRMCAAKASEANKSGSGKIAPSRTRVLCTGCAAHLCLSTGRNCFRAWHTKLDLTK